MLHMWCKTNCTQLYNTKLQVHQRYKDISTFDGIVVIQIWVSHRITNIPSHFPKQEMYLTTLLGDWKDAFDKPWRVLSTYQVQHTIDVEPNSPSLNKPHHYNFLWHSIFLRGFLWETLPHQDPNSKMTPHTNASMWHHLSLVYNNSMNWDVTTR